MAAEAASAVDETFVPLDGDASAARQASSSLEATGTESVGSCVQVSLKRATASYVCGYCTFPRIALKTRPCCVRGSLTLPLG